ncbi:STR2 [Cyberlindnera jadinii]|uniref:cystathionine gamma-synthase n=1 Tax=Cyberlindnera jadinii (strain ATCC 18201 / CBS 1600 / BCRC 20928 / JCM 3617 / NBRC 0987 / NRRL Y-1542) TaxID=983966 RepID=A0A0H5C048_CYBJN|nr:PLP-dependent transferase [Cyberlindnera jadinii NRRL Y-1542]ODV76117.1 PLP-dependent transferase [Cyberlindnera jadinii NRRL Y-1542]CEP20802.1 STR2 [Cyberlindnera jadinii]
MEAPSQEIGESIPNNTPHAVSVTLPTWEATVGYERGEDWVVQRMKLGYPRFFIHSKIKELCALVEEKFGREGERAFVFPSYAVAKRCREFVKEKTSNAPLPTIRILQLSTPPPRSKEEESYRKEAHIAAVFVPESEFVLAKNYWQHSGEGISSRLGEYVLQELKIVDNNLQEDKDKEYKVFIEERFGRNLDLGFTSEAKTALRRRIAGVMDEASPVAGRVDEDDVFLYPSGMAAIFNAHLCLLKTLPNEKSVCFGFPYVDTLNILKKFGPGVHFYGFGDDDSLDELEAKLSQGEKILGLFCECPSNPLLKTPNLKRIHQLSLTYKFPVVVDETVGNFLNIDVRPYTDIIVSSLTKVFSGDSNVMAGSLVINPASQFYPLFQQYFRQNYEDIFWAEDAIYLERNSRDFESRSHKVNVNSEAVVDLFQKCPIITQVFYPKVNDSRKYYEDIKTPNGGYGGLISIVFQKQEQAVAFFDSLELSKGPSLGTNFTLVCPYAILAHYQELDEVEKWGIDRNLVRLSIGLEDQDALLQTMQMALNLAIQA